MSKKMNPMCAWIMSRLLIYIPDGVLPDKDYLIEKNKRRRGARSLFWSSVVKNTGREWRGDGENRRTIEELLFHLEIYSVDGVKGIAFYPLYYNTHRDLCRSFFKNLQELRLDKMGIDRVWLSGRNISILHIIFPQPIIHRGDAYASTQAI